MRIVLAVALAVAHAVPVFAAETLDVELTGGFHAVGHPSIATGEKSQAYAYAVRGGTVLHSRDGRRIRVAIDCAGLDRVNSGGETTGSGHCTWSDADGDRLFVSLQTADGGNAYTITGGSGKWRAASGSIRTRFSYLPSPEPVLFLGVEEGAGQISAPAATEAP